MGRCYEKLNDAGGQIPLPAAHALANNSYYGLRAREAENVCRKRQMYPGQLSPESTSSS
jgi:hypothetical protein